LLHFAALWSVDPASAQEKRMTDAKKANGLLSVLTYDDVRAVSPALEHYTKEPLLDGLWNRPEMSPRDRSIVTVAALIARIQTIEMPFHFAVALDNGVKPVELSEIITHLAFLLRMGKCDVRGCRGKGHLSTARNWNRSTSTAKDKLMPLTKRLRCSEPPQTGDCPDCAHMLWLHRTEGGCMYRSRGNAGVGMDEAGDCPCTKSRPLQKIKQAVELTQSPIS